MEFDRTGQEGFTDNYDPRFSVAFVGLGEITASNPCYVRECAFHDGFSPAIGVFGTNYMDVTDNVIHNTVGSGKQNNCLYNIINLQLKHIYTCITNVVSIFMTFCLPSLLFFLPDYSFSICFR